MNHRGINILVVCACGAGLGSLISLHLGIFWPIGLFVGMLFGYIFYDWREALNVFRRQLAKEEIIPGSHWLRSYFWICLYRWIYSQFIISLFIPIIMLNEIMYISQTKPMLEIFLVMEIAMLAFLALQALADEECIFSQWDLDDSSQRVSNIRVFEWFHQRKNFLFEIKIDYFHPTYFLACFIFPFYVYHYMGVMMLKVVKRVLLFLWKCMLGLPRAIWFTFKYIHSDLRVLCAVDSGIGAIIGFLAGNPIVGAVVGGIIGYVNYEVVSKRLLKLPTRSK